MQGPCMQGFVGEDDMGGSATTARAERTERGDIGKGIGKQIGKRIGKRGKGKALERAL